MNTAFVSVLGATIEYEFESTGLYFFAIGLKLLIQTVCKLIGAASFVLGIILAHNTQNLLTVTSQQEALRVFASGGEIALIGVGFFFVASILSFVVVEGIWRVSAR